MFRWSSHRKLFSSFQWPTTTSTNPSSALVPWLLRLTSFRRRAPTPVPTTQTKWLPSLSSISTIRVSLWGSRSESHHKNWIKGIRCLIIHAYCDFPVIVGLQFLWQTLWPSNQGHWGNGLQHTERGTSIWRKTKGIVGRTKRPKLAW